VFSGKQGVHIQVTDVGIGFSPDERKSLFDKHFRTKMAKRCNRGGLGFGLYFVKKVIAAHGGSIDAASAGTGKGSAFLISLNRKNASPR